MASFAYRGCSNLETFMTLGVMPDYQVSWTCREGESGSGKISNIGHKLFLP